MIPSRNTKLNLCNLQVLLNINLKFREDWSSSFEGVIAITKNSSWKAE